MVGTKLQLISNWERGKTSPTLRNLDRWCEALGQSLIIEEVKVQ